jgi:CRISPR system Cascade subunit CasC
MLATKVSTALGGAKDAAPVEPEPEAATESETDTTDKAQEGATVLYYTLGELGNAVKAMIESEGWKGLVADALAAEKNPKKKVAKADQSKFDKLVDTAVAAIAENAGDDADMRMFGRMVASEKALNVAAAASFSHAVSTHAVVNDLDFFTAVDDKPGVGAGYLDTAGFNSACYYRYVGINLDMVAETFKGAEYIKVLKTFLKACIEASPQAKKNSMFGISLPLHVFGLRRDAAEMLSLSEAFETPVHPANGGGYLAPSKDAMMKHYATLKKMYGLTSVAEVEMAGDKGVTLDELIEKLVNPTSAKTK